MSIVGHPTIDADVIDEDRGLYITKDLIDISDEQRRYTIKTPDIKFDTIADVIDDADSKTCTIVFDREGMSRSFISSALRSKKFGESIGRQIGSGDLTKIILPKEFYEIYVPALSEAATIIERRQRSYLEYYGWRIAVTYAGRFPGSKDQLLRQAG